MKVLLLKDVYKLGRAGEVKRVADGYGRNYLLPQGMAILATPGAMKQAERIREVASVQRQELNKEMSGIAEKLKDVVISFPARASETGKLYGSVTPQMIADALSEKAGLEITRRQIDSQPLRSLGDHKVHIRLTVDLVPEVSVIVYREGEAVGTESGHPVVAPQPEPELGEAEEPLTTDLTIESTEESTQSELEPEPVAEPVESEDSDVVEAE
jgi:large subunit ribosomal protein L9